MKTYILLSISLVVVMISCHSTKEIVNAKNINDKELREILFQKETVPFDFFYTKISVDYENSAKSYDFSTSVKMRVDSAFSGTIKFALIVVATYLVDQDSLKFTNKSKKCYNLEDLSFISTMLGTKIEYDFFQALLLGLPVGLDQNIKYIQINAKDHYILSSHKKKDFKKLEHDKLKNEESDDIFIQYHLAPETFDLTRINIQVPADTVEIDIEYKERKLIDEKYWVPEETNINIYHPRDTISINMNYGIVKINEAKRIKISIPDSYEQCAD